MKNEPLTAEEYLTTRVDDQLEWYSAKSATNKTMYLRLQCFALIAASSIPLIVLSFDSDEARYAVAVIGALTAIVGGLLSLFQYRDLWVDYRSTAEVLKREKYLFLAKAPPYDEAQAFPLFVNTVESIIASENTQWRDRALTQQSAPDATDTYETGEGD